MNACNCLQINTHTFWARLLCTNYNICSTSTEIYYTVFDICWFYSPCDLWRAVGEGGCICTSSLLLHCVHNSINHKSFCRILIIYRQSKSNKFGTFFYTSFSFSLVHFTQILKLGKVLMKQSCTWVLYLTQFQCNWTTEKAEDISLLKGMIVPENCTLINPTHRQDL